jgi:polar amino acid transport system substrate-binding protein
MQTETFTPSLAHRALRACGMSTALLLASLSLVAPASAGTLERIKESGHIKFGYIADARPFTYKTDAGAVEGYAATLCDRIAAQAKKELGLNQLAVDWVPVTLDSRLTDVRDGKIDLLCTPTSVTLSRRQEAAFSIPVFPGGVRAVMRVDTSAALRKALAETATPTPVWRGAPAAKTLAKTTFAVMSGTTTERWLAGRRSTLQIDAKVITVPDYKAGLQALRDRKADVFFGDRALVLGALHGTTAPDLFIFDRLFTQESFGLALPRDDDTFRLLVDRSLSQLYTSELGNVYRLCCGEPDAGTRAYFQWITPPE